MRLTTPAGLAVRALIAATINITVFVISAIVVIAAIGFYLVTYLPFWEQLGEFWTVTVALGFAVGFPLFVWIVRETIYEERRWLLEETTPLSETALDGGDTVDAQIARLASQFDVSTPELRIHSTDAPLAYTSRKPSEPVFRTGGESTPVVVVSAGLVEALPRAELEAVLAHELAHIANGDDRLITWVLVPLVAAEVIRNDDEDDVFGTIVGGPLAVVASIGVGVFSRGREVAADRAAAIATGDPGTLAAALERLDESAPAKPTADLRKHARTTNAVNVLPTLEPNRTPFGLRSTHPSLERRIEYLRTLVDD